MSNQEEILEELKSLREQVKRLESRLESLELKQPPKEAPEPIPYKEVPERPPEIEKPKIEKEKEITFLPEKKPVDIEETMGIWLPRIGMLAILFGVGFFLKYAFDHQWIGPTGRIIMGLLGGVSLLGAGEYFESKKYHGFSRVFTGSGLALLYFSLYAARNFYDMLGVGPTFISMLFVTLAAGFFAVRYNSQAVAFYSIIGGFLTTFLIGYTASNRISLLVYIAILNLGILAIAFFKKWRILNSMAFIFTAITFLATYGKFSASESLSVSFGFLTFYFLIFAFVAFLYNILYRLATREEDIFLVLANAFYYYIFSYIILKPDYENLLGLFTFGLALFFLILAWLAFWRNARDKFLPMVLLGTCVAFITIGIAVQFENHWITIFWTLEALGLLWLGFKMKEILSRAYITRFLALVIFVLTFIRLLAVHTKIPSDEFTPIVNKRVFIFLLYALSLFLMAGLYSYYKEKIRQNERKISTVCTLVANFLIVYLISAEIIDYFGLKIKKLPGRTIVPLSRYYYEAKRTLLQQRNACLSIGWALYSILLIVIGIIKRYRPIRLFALTLFGITILKVFVVDLSYLKGFSRILSFIILGLILLGAGFLYNKYKDKIREFV